MRNSRKVLLGIVIALVVLFSSSFAFAEAYTDWLWFDEVGQQSVWTTTLRTKVFLAFGFGVAVFAATWGNALLAERKTIDLDSLRAEEEIVERYQELVGPYRAAVRLSLAAFFAFVTGTRATSQWQNWLLFRHGGSFGREDPVFGNDAGFYVFKLPFLSFFAGWLFAVLLFLLVIVVVLYYLNGQIRLSRTTGVAPAAKLHISILLALIALTRAAMYWIDRYELLHSDQRKFSGALATDVNLLMPGFYLLTLISILGAGLLLWNVRREGWGLPIIVVGLWVLSHILIVGILPALYQNYRVDPQEVQQEKEFVGYNIEATKFAYGLDSDKLKVEQYDHTTGLTAEDLDEYSDVLDNVPILDPELTSASFSALQGERVFYQFAEELDVDRYEIDGQQRPVVLSVRGLNLAQVDPNWERRRVSFTHGYGVALASGVEVENDRPVLLIEDLDEQVPVDERLDEELDQPRIYFGEDFGGYAVVNARADEIDFQLQNETTANRYDGDGGIDVSSLRRQLAFAIRFQEIDPLISQNVQNGSKVILNRDIETRVQELAPFLKWDSNPYPVVADGGIYWMMDGYTTSDRFPYGQKVDSASPDSQVSADLNYLRSSVKAVINAYTGETTLYIVDEQDPIIDTWADVYPGLFSEFSTMPASLQEHLRYPSDAFTVQTDMWSRYHVSDVEAFIKDVLTWSVARQPARDASSSPEDTVTQSTAMKPQYLMAKLPGSDETEFVLQRGYVPLRGANSSSARLKMQGLMVAQSDLENYGKLVSYEIAGNGSQPNAPELIHSDIQKVDGISDYVTLRSRQGSDLKWGPMSIVMVDDTFVFVRPVYVLADGQQSLPELRNVIAVNGDRIAMRPTLDAALEAVVSGAPAVLADQLDGSDQASGSDAPAEEPPATTVPSEAETPTDSTVQTPSESGDYDPTGKSIVELLADADRLLVEAEAADASGEATEATRLRQGSQAAIAEAKRLLQGQ